MPIAGGLIDQGGSWNQHQLKVSSTILKRTRPEAFPPDVFYRHTKDDNFLLNSAKIMTAV